MVVHAYPERVRALESLVYVWCQDFFNGKEPNRGINPDEAVAYGAAVQAGILSGEGGQDLLLLDAWLGVYWDWWRLKLSGGGAVVVMSSHLTCMQQSILQQGRDSIDPGYRDRGRCHDQADLPQHSDPDKEESDLLHLPGQPACGEHPGLRGRATHDQGQPPAGKVRARWNPSCSSWTAPNRGYAAFASDPFPLPNYPIAEGTSQAMPDDVRCMPLQVTFEIDSNGILNVGAEDKGTGKSEKITITNDKGRLTEEQIEKMIREAEEFADEDKKVKERVDAKNAFDGYIHSMRSATEGSGDNKGLSEKMDSDEKEKILDALKDGQSWLDSNPEADAEEIKEKHKEVEGICAPIVSKYYGGGGAGGAGGADDDEEEAHDEL